MNEFNIIFCKKLGDIDQAWENCFQLIAGSLSGQVTLVKEKKIQDHLTLKVA